MCIYSFNGLVTQLDIYNAHGLITLNAVIEYVLISKSHKYHKCCVGTYALA